MFLSRYRPAGLLPLLFVAVVAACGEGEPPPSRVFGEREATATATATVVVQAEATPLPAAEGAVPGNLLLQEIPVGRVAPAFLTAPLLEWTGLGDGFGAERSLGLVHGGVDFEIAGGQEAEVYAPCDGYLIETGQTPTHGLYLTLDCGGGWSMVLGTLSTARIATGDFVMAGETIAGTIDGGSGGSSLHFAVRLDGKWINPGTVVPLEVRPGTPRPVTPTLVGPPAQPSFVAPPLDPSAEPSPTSTPTPFPTATPPPTQDFSPTQTPTRTPISSPTPRPPTPTPTELPRAF